MAVPFTQLVASTYDDVVNERNKAADQWSDSSFLKHLEKLGGVQRVPGGATLQLPLDYRQNPGYDFLATDTTATSTTKTEVLTAASYSFVPLVVPINWTLTDEALNSEANQKVDLAAALVDNAIASHDYALEAAMFATTGGTDGFNTMVDLYTEDGTGTVGTIVSGTETWWKNQFKDYDAAAALLADMTTVWNSSSKGSMGRTPNVIVTAAAPHGVYEGKLVANQRYVDAETAQGGFKVLKFKTADVVFTAGYSSDSYFFFNTNDTKLFVVRSAWRQRRSPVEFANAAMMNMKIFSVAQLATRNRSRGACLFT